MSLMHRQGFLRTELLDHSEFLTNLQSTGCSVENLTVALEVCALQTSSSSEPLGQDLYLKTCVLLLEQRKPQQRWRESKILATRLCGQASGDLKN